MNGESKHAYKARVLAHILQGAEARALNIACKPYRDRLLLLQHDGFTASKCVNRRTIEHEIAVSDLALALVLEAEKLVEEIGIGQARGRD